MRGITVRLQWRVHVLQGKTASANRVKSRRSNNGGAAKTNYDFGAERRYPRCRFKNVISFFQNSFSANGFPLTTSATETTRDRMDGTTTTATDLCLRYCRII